MRNLFGRFMHGMASVLSAYGTYMAPEYGIYIPPQTDFDPMGPEQFSSYEDYLLARAQDAETDFEREPVRPYSWHANPGALAEMRSWDRDSAGWLDEYQQ